MSLVDEPLAALFREEIRSHHRAFRALAAGARRRAAAGNVEGAAVFASLAADLAWHHPPGLFASGSLERLVLELSRRAVGADASAAPRPRGGPRRILHAITAAYGVGGHTRLAWRWIGMDAGREHRVALTAQGRDPVPEPLAAAVGGRAGSLSVLDADGAGPIERARRLRALAESADLVVLHVHPGDVVPPLAFGARGGLPPVVVVNHADHVFWLGTGVCDFLLNLRDSGRRLAEARRGIPCGDAPVLLVPTEPAERKLSREEAKRRLGEPADRVLGLSVAAAYKYAPTPPLDFLATVSRRLEQNPRAAVLVVGPKPEGRWAEAERRTGGRLRALGERRDLALHWQAADVYLDSFPFTSPTALVEAGGFATPVLGVSRPGSGAEVLFADDATLPASIRKPATVEAYGREFDRLFGDRTYRETTGDRLAAEIRETRRGSGWTDALERVYAAAAVAAPPPAPRPPGHRIEDLDLLLQGLQREIGGDRGYRRVLKRSRGGMSKASPRWWARRAAFAALVARARTRRRPR